jgi:thioredoxin-like negative regulator of GroEL
MAAFVDTIGVMVVVASKPTDDREMFPEISCTPDGLRQLVAESKILLLNVGEDYCGPCSHIRRELKELWDKAQAKEPIKGIGMRVVCVDLAQSRALADHLGITRVPTQFLYKGGKLVGTHQGRMSERRIIVFLAEKCEDDIFRELLPDPLALADDKK